MYFITLLQVSCRSTSETQLSATLLLGLEAKPLTNKYGYKIVQLRLANSFSTSNNHNVDKKRSDIKKCKDYFDKLTNRSLVGVVAGYSDTSVYHAGIVRSTLQVKGLQEKDSYNLFDKLAMKQVMKNKSITTSSFTKLDENASELISFLKKYSKILIKKRLSAGSEGITIAKEKKI